MTYINIQDAMTNNIRKKQQLSQKYMFLLPRLDFLVETLKNDSGEDTLGCLELLHAVFHDTPTLNGFNRR